jgi:hypothetical protein
MELLAPLAVILLSIFGMIVCHALKAACQEASAMGERLIVESQQAREEFDQVLQRAMQALQKPQSNEVAERLIFRMELKGR